MPKSLTFPEFGDRALSYIELISRRAALPNALIVNGPDEDFLRKYAVHLVSAVVCDSHNKPCGTCESCRRVLNKITPDVIDVYAEDGKQSINVDQARNIRADAYIAPSELEIKVYILHAADKMNAQAQNALLKILEEPPTFASFILFSSNLAAFLPTVRSRCQLVYVDADEKKISVKSSKLHQTVERTIEVLAGNRKSELVDIFSSFSNDRQEFRDYITVMMQAFRDVIAAKSGKRDFRFFDDPEVCVEYSSVFSENAVIAAYDTLNEALVENDANIYILLSQTRLMSGLWRSIHN